MIQRAHGMILVVGLLSLVGCAARGGPRGETRSPVPGDIYYLHLYSTVFDIPVPTRTYGIGEKWEQRNYERLATIAISSGAQFYANLPNQYEPEMTISGSVEWAGDSFEGPIRIFVQAVDIAYLYEHTTPVRINEIVQLDAEPFYFIISSDADPYALGFEID